jgi:hypothetical protein
MNPFNRLVIFALLSSGVSATAEDQEILLPLTPAEANRVVADEMHSARQREQLQRNAIESVKAIEEKTIIHGQNATMMRRVPSKPWTFKPPVEANTSYSLNRNPQASETRFRSSNLSATVFDRKVSQLFWRKGDRAYTILSNIDFNYLTVVSGFEDAGLVWSVFLMVDNVDTELEKRRATAAANEEEEYSPRLMPESAYLLSGKPDYVVYAENADEIPDALIEELGAFHRYYATNEATLKVTWHNQQVMNEARAAWLAANPPVRKPTVINFWPVRSSLHGKKQTQKPKP